MYLSEIIRPTQLYRELGVLRVSALYIQALLIWGASLVYATLCTPHPAPTNLPSRAIWTTRCSWCCFRIASLSVLSTISETNFWHVPANIILCSTIWPFSCPARPSPDLSLSIIITIWFITKCDFCNCVTMHAVQVSYASWSPMHISGLVHISYVKWYQPRGLVVRVSDC